MAKIVVKVLGSAPKEIDASTVGGVKTALSLSNYTANVNGEPADDNASLSEMDFVTLSPAVKGG